MHLSKFLLPTLKEIPSEAQIKSHILMLKAGLIKKASSGLYYYLPLGMKVLNKVISIVREEMDKAGAQEILAPILIPKELLEKSERYEVFGDSMMRFADRHNKEYVLGPTHEESVTNLVSSDIKSYKDLPLNLYQINTKFRDEIRPRFGILRTREFIMKDAYSFHETDLSLDETYKLMSKTYKTIFKRCGLDVASVEASPGSMGGTGSEEFMVKSDVGEEVIMECPACNYTANIETAYSKSIEKKQEKAKELSIVDTPNSRTIKEVATLLDAPLSSCIKSLIYKKSDGEFVMVLISGDKDINEIKLSNVLNTNELALPSHEEIKEKFGLEIGYIGPIALNHDIRILADNSILDISDGIAGANLKDKHYINVCIERDLNLDKFYDFRLVKENDPCPNCNTPLKSFKGIEIGHIFKLGKKYTKACNVVFKDKNGKDNYPTMGCYGIGINRIPAAIIECCSDDNIVWPCSIAPFHIIITPINFKNEKQMSVAQKLYDEFIEDGVEVLFDDRDLRAGFKFKDADLIGIPFRINVGDKGLDKGCIELKNRASGNVTMIPIDKVRTKVKEIINKELKGS